MGGDAEHSRGEDDMSGTAGGSGPTDGDSQRGAGMDPGARKSAGHAERTRSGDTAPRRAWWRRPGRGDGSRRRRYDEIVSPPRPLKVLFRRRTLFLVLGSIPLVIF